MNALTTTNATYTDLINLYAHHLGCMKNELENVKHYTLSWARRELVVINDFVEQACNDAGKNWGPILSEGVNIKAASRALFIQRITEALEGLEGLKAALIKYSGEDAKQAASCDVQLAEGEDADAHEAPTSTTENQEIIDLCNETLKLAPRSEQAFINRCVVALDSAPMGDHGVYVHWFRIGYPCCG